MQRGAADDCGAGGARGLAAEGERRFGLQEVRDPRRIGGPVAGSGAANERQVQGSHPGSVTGTDSDRRACLIHHHPPIVSPKNDLDKISNSHGEYIVSYMGEGGEGEVM